MSQFLRMTDEDRRHFLEQCSPEDREALVRLLGEEESAAQSHAVTSAPSSGRTPLRAPPSGPGRLPTGTLLQGRYEIRAVLGEGGFGVVYEAWDRELRRPLAIKVLQTADQHLAANLAAAMQKEAILASRLSHPNVVTVYDTGRHEGMAFLAMELVTGESLRKRMDRLGRLPLEEVLRVGDVVLDVLGRAHERGVIHRDIKPENVLIDVEGRVKLMDFGIAKIVGDPDFVATETKGFRGTPSYAPPERIGGSTAPDPRGDLYSLAAMLYEALSGHRPHSGTNLAQLLYRIVHEEAVPLHRWVASPAHVQRTIMKGLARLPEDRHQNAAAFRAALRATEDGRSPMTTRHAIRLLAGVTAILALTFALGLVVRATSDMPTGASHSTGVLVPSPDVPPPPTGSGTPGPPAASRSDTATALAPPPASPAARSRLTITSTPSAAIVSIDGKKVGITPFMQDVVPGQSYRLGVSYEGYVTYVEDIVASLSEKELRISLSEAPTQQAAVAPPTPSPPADAPHAARAGAPSRKSALGEMAGTWSGTVKQQRAWNEVILGPSTYTVVVTLNGAPDSAGRVGKASIPAVKCNTVLYLQEKESTSTEVVMTSKVTSGPCVDGATLRLSSLGNGRVRCRWFYPNGRLASDAELSRSR